MPTSKTMVPSINVLHWLINSRLTPFAPDGAFAPGQAPGSWRAQGYAAVFRERPAGFLAGPGCGSGNRAGSTRRFGLRDRL